MSSIIKPKLELQLERQVAQAVAEKKSEITSRHVNELKNLGQAIKQSRADQRAMTHTTPAVNHIKSRLGAQDSSEEVAASKTNKTNIYTRQGKLKHEDGTTEHAQTGDEFDHVKDGGK